MGRPSTLAGSGRGHAPPGTWINGGRPHGRQDPEAAAETQEAEEAGLTQARLGTGLGGAAENSIGEDAQQERLRPRLGFGLGHRRTRRNAIRRLEQAFRHGPFFGRLFDGQRQVVGIERQRRRRDDRLRTGVRGRAIEARMSDAFFLGRHEWTPWMIAGPDTRPPMMETKRYAQPIRMAQTKTRAQVRNVVPPGNRPDPGTAESNDPGRLTPRVDVLPLGGRSHDRRERLS